MTVSVIGGGLAGCEAAWFLAEHGVKVTLYEQKPQKMSPAHHSVSLAELVCSNSLKAMRVESAGGLLKAEMRLFGSLCLRAADSCQVPAGGALAVDRDAFSAYITEKIKNHENISFCEEEVSAIPQEGVTLVATGPLTDGALAEDIEARFGGRLSFFDAAAPIVTAESLDMSKAFFQSRYDRGDDDYINCPMNKEEYEAFYTELISAGRAKVHDFDKRVYEGCMPIEIMAGRGADTIRFGPMKPVGLRDPRTGHRPWAVLQLRRENAEGTLYNLVGFQTNLKFAEQKRVFSMIPGLGEAVFARYGVMHRNTFLNSPEILAESFSVKAAPNIFFAGQITGVEGYMESAASGILAAVNILFFLNGKAAFIPPITTMTGALTRHVAASGSDNFQPMGASFGLLPGLSAHIRDKKQRYAALAERALDDLKQKMESEGLL